MYHVHAIDSINDKHIKAGHIYIKNAKSIVDLNGNTLLARCMKSLLGDESRQPVIASDFAYQNGEWKCNSSTYNESYIKNAFQNEWKPEYGEKIRELGNYEKCSLSRALRIGYMQNNFPQNINIGRYSEIKHENIFC